MVRPSGERVEIAGGRVALPRDSVAFVEERRLSWARTVGATWMGVGLALTLLQAAAGADR